MERGSKLRRGDLVEVKAAGEILPTLDGDGSVDGLPFMPEMLELCGRRFRVASRALTICYSGPGSPLGFRADDVVTLEGARCSGAAHDGCQKACMIFWREAWLRKVESAVASPQEDQPQRQQLRARLRTSAAPKTYFCQASELAKAADPLSKRQRLGRYLRGLLAGNFNIADMVHSVATWTRWKIRRATLGSYTRGRAKPARAEGLNLQPGDWVEVKSIDSINETLNERGHNRGLYFSPDMRLHCGRRRRVGGRIDRIIVDGTGQMRQLRDTVALEGSTCGCSYMGFGMGGCSRCELSYWREAWLRRCEGDGEAAASQPRPDRLDLVSGH